VAVNAAGPGAKPGAEAGPGSADQDPVARDPRQRNDRAGGLDGRRRGRPSPWPRVACLRCPGKVRVRPPIRGVNESLDSAASPACTLVRPERRSSEVGQGSPATNSEGMPQAGVVTQGHESRHSKYIYRTSDTDALLGLSRHLLLAAVFELQSFSGSLDQMVLSRSLRLRLTAVV